MNKYVLLMVMFSFLIVVTLVANDIVMTTNSVNVLSGAVSDTGTTSTSIFNMIGMFFKIITFQVDGIPVIINIIVFYPLTFGIIYIIVDILKDLIPFT